MRRVLFAGCVIAAGACQPSEFRVLGEGGRAATTGSVLQTIPNPDPQHTDWFGGLSSPGFGGSHSVRQIRTHILVGSIRDDVEGITDVGSFRLYDGFNGELVAELPNPSPHESAGFGWHSLGIADTIIAKGSDEADPSASGCLFQFTSAGEFLRKIPNPDPDAADYFGWPLAAVGNNFVTAATYDDPAGVPDAGSAFLFEGTTGNLIAEIPNPEPDTNDWAASFISQVGANFVIANRYDEPPGGGYWSGRAYLFDGATGALITPLADPTPNPNEDFGWRGALDIGGNRFCLATPLDFAPNLLDRPGSVHVFDSSTGLLDFTIPNPAGGNDRFGDTMATDGADRLLVAAPYAAVIGTSGAGAIYLFRASTGALITTIPNPRPAPWDTFGYNSMFVSGRIVVPVQSAWSGGVENAGAVYVFDTSGNLTATIDNPAPLEGIYFGNPIAVVGTTLGIGHAYDDADGVPEYGRISIFDLDGNMLSSIPNPGSMPEGLWRPQSLTAVAGNLLLGSPFDTVGGISSAGSLYLIAGPNDLPVGVADTALTLEDVPIEIAVLANDSDPDHDVLSIGSYSVPSSGTVVVAGANLLYTPDADFHGNDSFEYKPADSTGATSATPVSVSITVFPAREAPQSASSPGCQCAVDPDTRPAAFATNCLLFGALFLITRRRAKDGRRQFERPSAGFRRF